MSGSVSPSTLAVDGTQMAFPASLDLRLVGRRPIALPGETADLVLGADPARLADAIGRARSTSGTPRASIAIVTFNGLVFTRLCLESLLGNTDAACYEVVAVDNGSDDGTRDYLEEVAGMFANVRPIFNEENRGFAPAVNQALDAASGEILVLLNNDTIVPPGWLGRLEQHLADPAIGLIGPVTNRIGNEAEIEVDYDTYGGMLDFAQARARTHAGEILDVPEPIMFCAAMRRDTYAAVGALDERFELGLFEDSDYALRCTRLGYRTACAEDVFVHHFGGASFGQLFPNGEHMQLFDENRRRFELKWGEPWRPHRKRETAVYAALSRRLRAAIEEAAPAGSIVLIATRGDDALLRLDERHGWHFPRARNGTYGGVYPADSAEAVAQVEALRAEGAAFIAFPATARWWLDHYEGLRGHLEGNCKLVLDRDDAGVVFELAPDRG